jgi:Rieske Fe-S protein
MHMDRRTFLLMGTMFAAGCAAPGGIPASSAQTRKIVNAGPAGQYLKDGVYSRYCDLGFFIVRQGSDFFAVSSICTHRKCKLEAEPDRTFYCPCHDSTFDGNGHVTRGPARRDLPKFEISTNEKNELLVTIPSG